ncbi:alpha/beta fold hydrolase [Nocardiopsis sp. RSe5-2]|uniref:Alpha/beta fold hydrolase n=1 Tax=Nocardiopsis endophytica TaxID=3018445 RepID=A0ABT4TWN7_9ACTN|nr:alpha/beta fold hydrolase [Nocardiopsis endophytica]MDA2809092.1 alpha/beta fold hydrolase [Nocardiopsis endophytica]
MGATAAKATMNRPVRRSGAQAGPVTADGGGVPLSGLIAEPAPPPGPRAVLLALHGGGMRARYFHGELVPGQSLLDQARGRGHLAVALDRPGYGASAAALPDGVGLDGQVRMVRAAMDDLAKRHRLAAAGGFLLVGHSLGGGVALAAAAEDPRVRAVDVSGIGHRWAADPRRAREAGGFGAHYLHWGPLGLYPPGTFRLARGLTGPLPSEEAADAREWPERFDALADRVRVPVRFTFAEHERWWRHDEDALEELAGRLGAPAVEIDRMPGTGHNISLSRMAAVYHARVLDFFDACLAGEAGAA